MQMGKKTRGNNQNIPNAFIQTEMPNPKEDRETEREGGLEDQRSISCDDMLVETDHDTYKSYVVIERGLKVLYVKVLQAILYGMLELALLLEENGYVVNWHDPSVCIANKMVRGKPSHHYMVHVDAFLKASHIYVDPHAQVKNW